MLAYHKIDGGFELGVNSVRPQAFDHQMRFLAEQGYTAITVDRLIQAIDAFPLHEEIAEGHSFPSSKPPQVCSLPFRQGGKKNTPHSLSSKKLAREQLEGFNLPPRSVVITFDDGYEDFYTSAYPILKKYGLTATVFVLAGYIGKLNTWDVRLRLKRSRHLSKEQIQTLFSNGFGVASHGMHHCFLTRCNHAKAEVELHESKTMLENLLDYPIHSFAYPYGSVNPKAAERAKSAGYRIAFGLNPSQPITSQSVYCFPRVAIYQYDTPRAFQAKLGLLGEYRFKLQCMKNRVVNQFANLNKFRV